MPDSVRLRRGAAAWIDPARAAGGVGFRRESLARADFVPGPSHNHDHAPARHWPGGVRVKPASPSRPPGLDGYGGSAPRRPRTQFPAAGAGDGEHSSESIGKVLFFSSPGPCQLRPEAEVRSWHLFLPLSSTDPSRAVQVAWQLLPHAETIHPVGDPGRGSSVGGASEAPPV